MRCDIYKCIFVHTPKTAGHSILDAFNQSWYIQDAELKEKAAFLNTGYLGGTNALKEYKGKYKDYFKFAVIRNPWDKFISAWRYCANMKVFQSAMSDEFKNNFDYILNNLPQSNDVIPHNYKHITLNQYDMLYDKNGICIVDKIIHFENLQSEFDEVCDIIGKPKVKLKKLNTTKRMHYKEYFKTQQHLDIFYKNFKKDVDNLGYTF